MYFLFKNCCACETGSAFKLIVVVDDRHAQGSAQYGFVHVGTHFRQPVVLTGDASICSQLRSVLPPTDVSRGTTIYVASSHHHSWCPRWPSETFCLPNMREAGSALDLFPHCIDMRVLLRYVHVMSTTYRCFWRCDMRLLTTSYCRLNKCLLQLRRVVYLDTDTLVLTDIQYLLDLDMKGTLGSGRGGSGVHVAWTRRSGVHVSWRGESADNES